MSCPPFHSHLATATAKLTTTRLLLRNVLSPISFTPCDRGCELTTRLLLRNAVKGSGAINDVGTIHTDSFAIGKQILNDLPRDFIRLVPESRDKHHLVANIEI